MSRTEVKTPFQFFTDASGNALDGGYIYIGQPGFNAEAQPKTAYWDDQSLTTAGRPIRTTGGQPVYLGSPAKIFVDGDYSIIVKDKRGQLVYSSLSSVVIPGPDNIDISFSTLEEFNAATIPDDIQYVMAAGLLFVQDDSGTAQTSNGGAKKWSPPVWDSKPMHWGAKGDGVTDDTVALNAWASWTMAQGYDPTGFVDQSVVLDLCGKIYGVSGTVTIPDSPWTSILKDGSFVAISSPGFNNGTYDGATGNYDLGYSGWRDFVLVLESDYMNVQNVAIYCQSFANGILMNGGRQKMRGCLIRRMVNCGVWQPVNSGGDKRIESCLIQQQNLTASGETPTDPSSYTAIGVLSEQSDCKITNSTISWCLKNWVGTGGVQNIYGCHIFHGVEGSPVTFPVLIEWKTPSLSGSLSVHDTYLDNGYVDIYNDKADFNDCGLLLDDADVTLTSMFRVYCHLSAQDASVPRVKINNPTLYEYDGANKIVEFLDEDFTWAAGTAPLEDIINDVVTLGNQQTHTPNLMRQQEWAVQSRGDWVHRYASASDRALIQLRDRTTTGNGPSFGSVGDTAWLRTPDGPLVIGSSVTTPYLSIEDGVATFLAFSSEPTASNFSIAMSDGTASTNSFGTAGAGLYQKLAGTWAKL